MKYFISIILCLALAACSSEPAAQHEDSAAASPAERQFTNDLSVVTDKPGIAGITDVPEMLCLSIMDSSAMSGLQEKIQTCYTRLEEDIALTGSERNGPFGQISYSNDTTNFKFECFALIRKLPGVQPKWAKLVVLEADRMLLYNYYGPYQMLYAGYGELGEYAKKEKLKQSGPLREYYFTDPARESDRSKLRTILMMPVRKQ